MPFEESMTEYENKLRAFAAKYPEVTAEDMEKLFPRLRSAPDVWARFNSAGRHIGNGAKVATRKA